MSSSPRAVAALLVVLLVGAAALADPASEATEDPPAAEAVIRLAAFPPALRLEGARDRASVVVQATLADGTTRDVSEQAELALADPSLAAREGRWWVGRADGETTLTVRLGERALELPVVVRQAGAARPVSFRNDSLPVLTRAGCNTGSCHGAARGKDGFRLSLFGYDPAGDHWRITREQAGRRIDLAAPAQSLLLLKATGQVRHTGGARFAPDGPEAALLTEWLAAGAPQDPADLPELTGIALAPPDSTLLAGRGRQQLVVTATYSDGTDRDVTALAALQSSDGSVAAIDSHGAAVAGQRGEALVTARFGAFVVGATVLVVPDEPGFRFPAGEDEHPVDRHVAAKLRRLRQLPAPVIDDAAFLRRAALDVIGRLPEPEEVEAFLADPRPDKRARAVDALLDRKEFAELWTLLWADRLLVRSSERVSPKAALRYAGWIQARIAGGVPLDAMVRELLTAEGGTFEQPATNFYQAEPDGLRLAENVAQVFLGIRLQCAQCHDHPFDRWTQDDYYGWAAFFSQVGRKRGADPRERIVFDQRRGEVEHPLSGEKVAPRLLGGEAPAVKGKDRRAVAAAWITAPDNPFFARNVANLVWAQLLGEGLVHEPDDVRVSNPPSHPALLDELATRLVESGWDIKALIRLIASSRTYQRATRPDPTNAHDARNLARGRVRRLRAEVLLDAIGQVTGAPIKLPGLPLGARAVQLADGAADVYPLRTFGRASRESVCACEVKAEPTLSQALHLLNGATVHDAIVRGGRVEQALAAGRAPTEVLDELYLRCLARRPSPDERASLLARLETAPSPREGLEDVFWALLNSPEFLTNH